MSFWTGVVVGAIIGWLAEWIIDWNYWRRRTRLINVAAAGNDGLRVELETCRTEMERLRTELSAASSLAQQRAGELATLQAALANAQASLQQAGRQIEDRDNRLATMAATETATRTARETDVAEIERLREALAHAEETIAELRSAQPAVPQQTLLGAVPVSITARLVDDDVQAELAQLRAQLAEEQRAHALLRGAQRDPLIDINGIGPVYEKRLNEAGIQTFAELAALTPERVHAIIHPESWQHIDPEAWINEARLLLRRSNPDPLVDINGIGPVYQDRLFDARIYTFAQLAAMTTEQLAAIIQPEEWQGVEFDRWIAEAAQFAARMQEEGR